MTGPQDIPRFSACWRFATLCLPMTVLLNLAGPLAADRVPDLNVRLHQNPQLTTPMLQPHLPENWQKLWRSALTGEDDELRRRTAAAILREHQRGTPEVADMAADLVTALQQSPSAVTKLAIIRVLDANDVRESAGVLADEALHNESVAALAEPLLAKWQDKRLQDVWQQRLRDRGQETDRRLIRAVQGLAATADTSMTPVLQDMVIRPSSSTRLRLAAARALGQLHTNGLQPLCRELLKDESPGRQVSRLAAVRLLTQHSDSQTVILLRNLANDSSTVTARPALQRLLEVAPQVVAESAEALLSSTDAEIRRLAVRPFVQNPTEKHISVLAPYLADPVPQVRIEVRQQFYRLSSSRKLRESILEETLKALDHSDWRAVEQAAVLCGELRYSDAAEQLIDHLSTPRWEVHVSAAWALRELALPDSLPQIHAVLSELLAPVVSGDPNLIGSVSISPGRRRSLALLFELLGQERYRDAANVLLPFVAKRPHLGTETRVAAIWALGMLYQGQPNPQLGQDLLARMTDESVNSPESPAVKSAAAVALARIGDTNMLPEIEQAFRKHSPVGLPYHGLRWACEQLSGTSLPDPPVLRSAPLDSFFSPLD